MTRRRRIVLGLRLASLLLAFLALWSTWMYAESLLRSLAEGSTIVWPGQEGRGIARTSCMPTCEATLNGMLLLLAPLHAAAGVAVLWGLALGRRAPFLAGAALAVLAVAVEAVQVTITNLSLGSRQVLPPLPLMLALLVLPALVLLLTSRTYPVLRKGEGPGFRQRLADLRTRVDRALGEEA